MAEPSGPQHTSDASTTASDGSSTPVELDELLARRRSPVRRVTGALAVLAALLVAAAMILYPQLPGTVFPSAAQVTPLHTPLPMPITIKSNVNYGVLRLNGQPLGAPPVRNVRLRTGRDVVTLVAAPFNPRSCVVVAPITISGRGAIVDPETTCSVSVTGGQGEFDIAIPLDLSNLPPSLQSGALAAAEQTLAGIPAQTATVRAGQYYVIGTDQSGLPLARRATSPLTAAVSLSVSAPSATAPPPSEYRCATILCSGPTDPGLMPSRNSWLVDVAMTIQWRFSSAAGAVVSAVAFPATAAVLLAITYVPAPAGSWRLRNRPRARWICW